MNTNHYVVEIDIDDFKEIGDGEARGLIRLLRRSREDGGDVRLRVTREDLKHSLRIMALDRLFAIES